MPRQGLAAGISPEWNEKTLLVPRRTVPVDTVRLDASLPPPSKDISDAFWNKVERRETKYRALLTSIDPQAILPPCPADEGLWDVNAVPAGGRRAHLMHAFGELRRRPLDAQLFPQAACFLQRLSRTYNPPSHGLDWWMMRVTPARPTTVATGCNGVVVHGMFLKTYAPLLFPSGVPPAFLLKTALRQKSDTDTINELLVGVLGTNLLRPLIPNFMYVYGGFKASPSVVDDEQGVELCRARSDPPVVYEMIETIADALDLETWIARHALSPNFDQAFAEVILQILYALAVANDRLPGGFSHCDLHDQNVLVRDLGKSVRLVYPGHDGRDRVVTTRWLATLIDFGRAVTTVQVPGGPVVETGTIVPWLGLFPGRHNHLYDVLRLLGTSLLNVRYASGRVFSILAERFLRPFFGDEEGWEHFLSNAEDDDRGREDDEEDPDEDEQWMNTDRLAPWSTVANGVVPYDVDVDPWEVADLLAAQN